MSLRLFRLTVIAAVSLGCRRWPARSGEARRGFEVQAALRRHRDGPRRRVDRKGPARVARRDAVGERLAVASRSVAVKVADVRHRRGVGAVLVEAPRSRPRCTGALSLRLFRLIVIGAPCRSGSRRSPARSGVKLGVVSKSNAALAATVTGPGRRVDRKGPARVARR